uniref:Uncharacterized protein n=1 Tax=Meloidogyne enterolobii TaxID=390850 RepID=A0A6V7TY50_MELEN|nr:unnamed protein product [Meloidogyne enterolobii]
MIMENKQNQTNNYKNNKNKLNLPLEAFFDIINAANTSDMIINDDNTITKYTSMVLQLKEYFIKIMSSSAIIYAFAGKNFIKMFGEFKVR